MASMPVLFVGHGSPMNVVEKNPFTEGWRAMAAAIPRPRAVLCVSAHWYIEGDLLSGTAQPATIHDFYGFPEELYAVRYPAPGAPALAQRAAGLLPGAQIDPQRGLDHGAWSVLRFLYPDADIPVVQLSVNAANTPQQNYQTGRALRPLRDEGVLILGSGNIVHNLGRVSWEMDGGYDWADEFDARIKKVVLAGRPEEVIHYEAAGPAAAKAFSIRDHYDPLLYALGAAGEGGGVQVFCDARVLGSISMTSYILG